MVRGARFGTYRKCEIWYTNVLDLPSTLTKDGRTYQILHFRMYHILHHVPYSAPTNMGI